MSEWQVIWSHQVEGPVNDVEIDEHGALVASGQTLFSLRNDGSLHWRSDQIFDVYSIEIAGSSVAVLTGTSIHVLDRHSGRPLSDGRSIPGGYREVVSRPGGGWVAADRGDHLHVFRPNGRGIRRLRVGSMRRLVGWLDREHLLMLDLDGALRCVRLHGEHAQRRIEDRRWMWCSSLERGRLLLLDVEGVLHEGVPNPFGWDELERITDGDIEPYRAVRCMDGWWTMNLEGRIRHALGENNIGFGDDRVDYLSSDGTGNILTATREGLLRWSIAPGISGLRAEGRRSQQEEERRRLDWLQRSTMFESAQQAEEEGLWTRALELYRALGRDEDVRRILGLQEGRD